MPEPDDNKVEDTTVETTTEQGTEEEPKVELDRPTEIEGDLVENPVLEVEDEPGEEQDDTTKPDSQQDADGSDGGKKDDTSESTPATVGKEPESTSKTTVEDKTGVYEPTKPDPGAFQPKGDYGFEVTTAEGQTVKINTPEEAEIFARRLDTEENLLTAYQFTQFQRNILKMDTGIDREKIQYDSDKQVYETQQAQEKVRNEMVTQWNNELKYLQTKGLLPEIPTALDVPGGWEKNPEDPGVKARMDIFKWMESENNDRKAAGISEITSAVDAFRLMQADVNVQTAKTEKKAAVASRQTRGKMVSGNSAFEPENTQKDSIVGEGGSLKDLVTEYSASQ